MMAKECGLASFKLPNGFEGTFAPQLPAGFTPQNTLGDLDDDPEIMRAKIQAAMDRFKEASKDNDINLNWST